MTANEKEKRILRLLKRNKSMLRRDIKTHFKLTDIEMNRASLRLRQSGMVVSVDIISEDIGPIKRWYDKEYAESKGIKPSHIISVKWSNTDKGEQPYIDRMILINSLWPKSMAYSA